MSDFVIPAPPLPSVPVAGGGHFPVRRIFCVGRNYAAHAREMGADPDREPPFFFMKPADAVLTGGRPMPYPPQTESLHFELELVAAIGTGGADIPETSALGHVWGYGVGIDMTRRDLQDVANAARRPWDFAKGFDLSAPVGDLVPAARIGHPTAGRIELTVNGAVRQSSDISHMIWNLAETIAHLSASVRLEAGDLIFTGTPEGVGATVPGDRLEGVVEGVGTVAVEILPRGH
jgi:fumarylpyruvate hydrolase